MVNFMLCEFQLNKYVCVYVCMCVCVCVTDFDSWIFLCSLKFNAWGQGLTYQP